MLRTKIIHETIVKGMDRVNLDPDEQVSLDRLKVTEMNISRRPPRIMKMRNEEILRRSNRKKEVTEKVPDRRLTRFG